MNTYFWIFSAFIVSIQVINHWNYGKGRLHISYPLSIIAFSCYLVLETQLALNNPDQTGILLFNITNAWGLFNAIKGFVRLRNEKMLAEPVGKAPSLHGD